MPITVAMIENKEFKVKMRGYDPEDVDTFLDEICDEMVAMQEEIASLQARLSRQAAAPAPVVPAPQPYVPVVEEKPVVTTVMQDSSEAAQKLLARAQKVYDETVEDAKKEAEEILKNAHTRAEVGLDALEKERDDVKAEIEMLKAAAKDYRARFQRLVEDQQHVLSAEKELFAE